MRLRADAESPNSGLPNPSVFAPEPLSTLIHYAMMVLFMDCFSEFFYCNK